MRKLTAIVVLASSLVMAGGATPARADYTDVPATHWAASAVDLVAVDNDWMRFGGDLFRPGSLVTRRILARALVRAFAPDTAPDPAITFPDLPETDPWYAHANVAVANGWLTRGADGSFEPVARVTKRDMDKAFIRALGLTETAAALAAISTSDGVRLAVPKGFGALVLAEQLRLHYNHPTGSEAQELSPGEPVNRAELAYALAAATQQAGGWAVTSLSRYDGIVLPPLDDARRRAVEWAFRWVGYPYVYAGEWHTATPPDYCCGKQAHGGFDCSGYTWWVVAKPTSGWSNVKLRGYAGWSLPQRSSYEMAGATEQRIALADLQPLDLVFFDTDGSGTGWRHVDHVGVSLGNGWMIHSSGGRAGATIDRIDEGWWAGAFRWGRRIVPIADTSPEPA